MNIAASQLYQHWEGVRHGIWYRRGVIAGNGLRGCLQVKWMRYLVTLCWASALVQVLILFFLGQLLVTDSAIVRWLRNLNPQLEAIGRSLIMWLEQRPDVSVRATYDILFYYFTSNLLVLTLVAIAMAIPHLITRDLSSNAILVYSSKALNRFDYLIGKFGTLLGLMLLTWLGPVIAAWFFGNLLSPNWHFFWHSRVAIGHAATVVALSMIILGVLGLGVSAVSGQTKATVSTWMFLWLVGEALVPIASQTKPWLKFLSFKFNLDQLALSVFQLRQDFSLVQEKIPLFGEIIANMRRRSSLALENPELGGAACGLAVMLVIAVIIVLKKARPE